MPVRTATLRERIIHLRRQKRLSQEDVCRAAGLSINTYSRYERGVIKDLRAGVLNDIASFLGVSPNDLLGFDEYLEAKQEVSAGV